jgi:hypothetical protein
VGNDGGTPKVVAGTEGLVPQSLDIIKEGAKNVAYFTGYGPTGAAVYKIDLAGGSAEEIFKADATTPVDTVSGITVSANGSNIYIVHVDTIGKGHVLEIKDGKGTPFLDDLNIASIGGIALSLDASELFVSLRDKMNNTSALLRYNVATKEGMPITDMIDSYNEPAGLHRARNANVFALVDTLAKGTGAIFVVR